MDGTELPCEKEIGNAHDPFARLPVLAYFSSTSVILVFADDTAKDGLLPPKDPMGSGNSSFSLIG